MTAVAETTDVLQYTSPTSHPESPAIYDMFAEFNRWVDEWYSPSAIAQSIGACQLREVATVDFVEAEHGSNEYDNIYVHGAHLGCSSDTDYPATHVSTDILANITLSRQNAVVSATFELAEVVNAPQSLCAETSFSYEDPFSPFRFSVRDANTFASVEALRQYLVVVQALAQRAMSPFEAAEQLISVPAWVSGRHAPKFMQIASTGSKIHDALRYTSPTSHPQSRDIYAVFTEFCSWIDWWYPPDAIRTRIDSCQTRTVCVEIRGGDGECSASDNIYIHGAHWGCDSDPVDLGTHIETAPLASFGLVRNDANLLSTLGLVPGEDGSSILSAQTTFNYEDRSSPFIFRMSNANTFATVSDLRRYLEVIQSVAQYAISPIAAGEMLISESAMQNGGIIPRLMYYVPANSNAAIESTAT